MQWARSPADGGVLLCLLPCTIKAQRYDSIDFWVGLIYASRDGLDQLERRDTALAEGGNSVHCREAPPIRGALRWRRTQCATAVACAHNDEANGERARRRDERGPRGKGRL